MNTESSSTNKSNVFTIRLTDEQSEKLTAYCERTGRSKVILFRKFCDQLDRVADSLFGE